MNSKLALSLLASSLCLMAACSPKAGPAASGAKTETGEARPILIENFSMGTRLGPHGGIAAGATERTFATDQIIYVAMELKHAPVGTKIRVIWKAQGDIVLAEETKSVRPGQRFMNFAADSSSLPLERKYQVDVFVGDKRLAQLEFGLIMASV